MLVLDVVHMLPTSPPGFNRLKMWHCHCQQLHVALTLAKPYLMAGERGSSCNVLHQDDRRLVDLQPHCPLHPHRHPHIHGHSQAVSQNVTISHN